MSDAETTITRADAAPAGPVRELAGTLRIALPLALTNLGNIAMNTTDVVMLGWLGAEALAAGMLGATTLALFMLMGFGVTAAVPPLAAQAHGAQDVIGVRRTIRQGFWAVALFSVPAIAILMQGETLLLLAGQDPDIAARAGEYLAIAAWALPFILGIMVLRALLATLARAGVVLVVTCIGILLNAAINWGLIFGNWGLPRLEVTGAAVATTATSAVGFLVLATYVALHPATRGYRVFSRLWRPDPDRLKAIGRLAWPISLTMLCEEGLFVASTLMVGWLGPLALAGHTVAMQCASVAFMVPLGVAQAATVRVGLAAGRGDRAGIGRAGWTGFALGLGFMGFVALLFWFAPGVLAAGFLDFADPDSPTVFAMAVTLLGVAALFQLFDGAQVVGLGVLRGLNDTRVPLAFAFLGYWVVGAPLAYVLGFVAGYGAVGVWSGFIGGLGLVAVLSMTRFANRERLGLLAHLAPAARSG